MTRIRILRQEDMSPSFQAIINQYFYKSNDIMDRSEAKVTSFIQNPQSMKPESLMKETYILKIVLVSNFPPNCQKTSSALYRAKPFFNHFHANKILFCRALPSTDSPRIIEALKRTSPIIEK